jgi:type I restriction enzyme S subunit
MAGEWRTSTWGDEISLEYGKALRGHDTGHGPYRVFGSNGPIGWTTEPLADGPGVILGRKGAYRGVRFSRDPFFVIDTAYYVAPKTGMDMRWLYYAIQHHKLGEVDDGSPVPSTTRAAVYMLDLDVPPLAEQRAIAHILGTLDDKIELNRRMSETLEAMARALFKSWFVDFDPIRAKAEGRDPGLPKSVADPFPDRLVDSELGEIPEGWEVGPLGDLIDTVKGRSYKSEELAESDTALVTLKSFARGGGYRPDGLKPFTGSYKPEQVVQPGDLVVACTDVTQAAEVIGRPAIVRGTGAFRRLVASLDTLIVRPKGSYLTRSFLYFLGGTEAFVAHTFAHTTGTTVLHLAKEAVPSFQFARPSSRVVEQFAALAGPVLERIQALEEGSGTLAALRDALLPKLISGELRVNDADTLMERVAS